MNKSCLYTFTDKDGLFALNLIEGQQLVTDLVMNSTELLRDQFSLEIYKKTVLSYMTLLTFIKGRESYAMYIDCDKPYIRLKLEVDAGGSMRSLLLAPDGKLPQIFSGQGRFLKSTEGQSGNYQSIVKVDQSHLSDLPNQMLKSSMQVDGYIVSFENVDHSLLIYKLGTHAKNGDLETRDENKITSREYYFRERINLQFFNQAFESSDNLISEAAKKGYQFINSRPIQFSCRCSRERMITGVRSIINMNVESFFEDSHGENFIDVKCDYCQQSYRIKREEVC